MPYWGVVPGYRRPFWVYSPIVGAETPICVPERAHKTQMHPVRVPQGPWASSDGRKMAL